VETLRTSDVARLSGYSVQQVRNLERDGVLPPVLRTPSGYRLYGTVHVRAALAYRLLAAGAGPVGAKEILRAVHGSVHRSVPEALALLDGVHARLDAQRHDLRLAQQAAQAISGEPIDDVRPSDSLSISELATALGVRPSTLRHWESERLVIPDRFRGARRYTPVQVRDARIVHQLRLAGYRIEPLRGLMPQLRSARFLGDVAGALAAREASITVRSRALLDGAAALSDLLRQRGHVVDDEVAEDPAHVVAPGRVE
jgi:DNA-binding transcriptional MerR regulator